MINLNKRRSFSSLPEVLTTSRFYVELKFSGSRPMPDAYFKECSAMQMSQEVVEIAEVTPGRWGQQSRPGQFRRTKLPGPYKVTNITLKRGLMLDAKAMWDWIYGIAEPNNQRNWARDRVATGKLVIYTQAGRAGATFEFNNAWPIKYSIPGVDAGKGELAIEELELAVEGLRRL